MLQGNLFERLNLSFYLLCQICMLCKTIGKKETLELHFLFFTNQLHMGHTSLMPNCLKHFGNLLCNKERTLSEKGMTPTLFSG